MICAYVRVLVFSPYRLFLTPKSLSSPNTAGKEPISSGYFGEYEVYIGIKMKIFSSAFVYLSSHPDIGGLKLELQLQLIE